MLSFDLDFDFRILLKSLVEESVSIVRFARDLETEGLSTDLYKDALNREETDRDHQDKLQIDFRLG